MVLAMSIAVVIWIVSIAIITWFLFKDLGIPKKIYFALWLSGMLTVLVISFAAYYIFDNLTKYLM